MPLWAFAWGSMYGTGFSDQSILVDTRDGPRSSKNSRVSRKRWDLAQISYVLRPHFAFFVQGASQILLTPHTPVKHSVCVQAMLRKFGALQPQTQSPKPRAWQANSPAQLPSPQCLVGNGEVDTVKRISQTIYTCIEGSLDRNSRQNQGPMSII